MDSITRRVAIQSPHEVVVRGFHSMLVDVSAVEVVEVSDRPDLVLYDVLGLHRGGGADLTGLLRDSEVTVLAVARDLRPDLVAQALAAGAHGIVPMDVTSTSLTEAVTAAVRFGPGTDDRSDRDRSRDRGHVPGSEVHLTGRERDVLGLIARGYSNQEVATLSFLSINSVKTYIRTAYRKIGVNSRSQAVIWCLTHGFSAEHRVDDVAVDTEPAPVTSLDRVPPGRPAVTRRAG